MKNDVFSGSIVLIFRACQKRAVLSLVSSPLCQNVPVPRKPLAWQCPPKMCINIPPFPFSSHMLSGSSGVPQEVFFQWLVLAHHKLQRLSDCKCKCVRGALKGIWGEKTRTNNLQWERERERIGKRSTVIVEYWDEAHYKTENINYFT